METHWTTYAVLLKIIATEMAKMKQTKVGVIRIQAQKRENVCVCG